MPHDVIGGQLGMKVEVIPGDFTLIMLDSGIHMSKTKPPTRNLIAEWVTKANNKVSVKVVNFSWRYGTYAWFDCY